LWASFERYYLAKGKLLASHNNNVNISVSPHELILFDKYVLTEKLKAEIEQDPDTTKYGSWLKSMVTDKDAPAQIPVIRTSPDYLRDSHVNDEGLFQWNTPCLFSEPTLPIRGENFINFTTKFSQEVAKKFTKRERSLYEIWEQFCRIVNTPHDSFFPRIAGDKVFETPLMKEWIDPGNKQKIVYVPVEKDGQTMIKQNISNWIVEALEEAQSYKPLQRQTPKPIIKKR
jgi:hypothetical protein